MKEQYPKIPQETHQLRLVRGIIGPTFLFLISLYKCSDYICSSIRYFLISPPDCHSLVSLNYYFYQLSLFQKVGTCYIYFSLLFIYCLMKLERIITLIQQLFIWLQFSWWVQVYFWIKLFILWNSVKAVTLLFEGVPQT